MLHQAAAQPCLSRHASRRAQQRAIGRDVLDWLLDHGERPSAGGGAEIVRLTTETRHELAIELDGRAARTLATAYAVVSAKGIVVTLGHRTRRVTRR